jgi:hypothetical protein
LFSQFLAFCSLLRVRFRSLQSFHLRNWGQTMQTSHQVRTLGDDNALMLATLRDSLQLATILRQLSLLPPDRQALVDGLVNAHVAATRSEQEDAIRLVREIAALRSLPRDQIQLHYPT